MFFTIVELQIPTVNIHYASFLKKSFLISPREAGSRINPPPPISQKNEVLGTNGKIYTFSKSNQLPPFRESLNFFFVKNGFFLCAKV
jgi:hypothetical protein